MSLKNCAIPAKAGIQQNLKKPRFPINPAPSGWCWIRSGMTSLWKTFLLYSGLLYGILAPVYAAYAAPIKIENPLGPNTKTIPDLIKSIVDQLTPLAVVIAIFAIVVVGFNFVIAAAKGDPNGLKEARKNLLWVLIGTAIVVGAYALATAAQTFFSNV